MARPTKKQQRIKEARALQANGTLQEIIEQRESDIIERWKSSQTVAEREAAWHDIIAIGELTDAIDTAASD